MNESTGAVRPLSRNPIATAIIGFCAGLLIAYGVGLWQRGSALAAQAEANAQIVAGKDAQIAEGAARLAAAELATRAASGRVALVQARLDLHQALNDLDQRNFGVAADRVRQAALRFDAIDAAALGLDPGLLAELQAEIAGTQVLVATDFELQRMRLLELAARIEAQTATAMSATAADPVP